jgi:hypothetical protein
MPALMGQTAPRFCTSWRASHLRRARRSHEVESFALQRQPLALGYDDFEALLLCMAADLFEVKKRPVASVEEYLGAFMDRIFRTAGVLVDYPQD